MNSQQQGHMNPGQGLKSSQYSTNHTMHLASQTADLTGHQNRFPSGQWPPRMPIGQHRPLPANYRCAICKKPGHPKSLCPDAVIKISKFKKDNLNSVFINFFISIYVNQVGWERGGGDKRVKYTNGSFFSSQTLSYCVLICFVLIVAVRKIL